MQLNRRTFIRQGASALAGLAAATTPRVSIGASSQTRKIVVVGAGMSGLSAAWQLVARGHDVTVLEARTRPGGRVFTLREAFADGLYADAGAMQVYDSHQRVQRYIKELGLELDPILPSAPGSLMHLSGRRLEIRPNRATTWPFPLNDDERALDSRGLFARYVVPHLKAIHDADVAGTLLDKFRTLDAMTFAEFVRSQGASAGAVRILNAGLPIGLGDGGDHHSALNLLREAAYRQLRTQAFTIRGGTDRLPKALASRLGERIHYGMPVVQVEQDATGVRAVTRHGGVTRTFSGDRLIVAAPFAAIRSVHFEPALSSGTREAIDELPNTSVVKVFVQTRTRFWIGEGQSGAASTDLPLGLLSERTINQPGTRGILEAYVTGEAARRLCALDERERLAVVTADIAKLFPSIAEHYESGTSKCWDDDPWSRGAYAWFRPGQMATLMPALGKADGRIHFAGDHSSSTPGWMEGALQSADRVVDEITRS